MKTKLLKIEEASAYLGIPANTLRHYRATKKGPPSAVIGGKVCYRESDLDRYIDEAFEAANA